MAFNTPQGGFRIPTPYDRDLASIARRERMAEMMQQQALQPIPVGSYNGIQAPISPFSAIAKALQMYAAVNAGDKADVSRTELGKRIQSEGAEQIASLEGRPAQPAIAPTAGTSFAPTTADYEDNPNLPVAASGNVEMAGTPGRPAIPAMPLGADEKKQRLIQILSSGNPYSAPVAKLMFEDLQKGSSGPLAEYKLYAEQTKAAGGTPLSIDAYKTRQLLAGRNVSNNTINMPAGAPIPVERNGKLVYVQMGKDGKYVEVEGISPPTAQTPLAQELADAGITKDNPRFQELATAFINKKLTQVISPNATVVSPTGDTSQAMPAPSEGTINVKIDGVTTAMPIAQANELNAKFRGAETGAIEKAKAGFEFVTIPDPTNPAQKILVPKSQVAAQSTAGTPVVAEVDKKEAQGQSALELARRAQQILPQATSGAISNLLTMATDAAGIPSNKSAADAQLRVIGAGLTANVPRMEGPQSNTDLLEYKRAAADVANPNVPYQTRMRALETVISLNEKYAKTPSSPPPGSVRRITPK
jgi:hypothetical protein